MLEFTNRQAYKNALEYFKRSGEISASYKRGKVYVIKLKGVKC